MISNNKQGHNNKNNNNNKVHNKITNLSIGIIRDHMQKFVVVVVVVALLVVADHTIFSCNQ